MAASWAERAEILLNSVKDSGGGAVSKIKHLRQLKEVILVRDPSLLPEFVPQIVELQEERASPVRRLIAELIGEIGMKNVQLLPDMVPTLISFLKDETPAVARQAITTGTNLFRNVLEKVVIQGLYSSGIDDPLKLSWTWMLRFKSAVFLMAFQPGIDGIRLLAVKFIEALVLLYTPDPDLPSDPPNDAGSGFNISWLKGGHPLLNVGDLALEASHSLRLLLDQLKLPQVKSLSNSMIIVLINSLSAIAKRRPSFYGRILPVLLCLDPASSVIKGVQVPGGHHALKNAFVACLKCTHSSAAPWRARLVEALKTMNSGVEGEKATNLGNLSGSMDISTEESLSNKEDKVSLQICDDAQNDLSRKRMNVQDNSDVAQDEIIPGKRLRVSPLFCEETSEEPLPKSHNSVNNEVPLVDSKASTEDEDSGPVQQLVGLFGALVSQGDKATKSLELLISSISSDLLAEVVMANIRYLPPSCPKEYGEEEPVPTMSFASTSVDKNPPRMQPSTVVSDTFSLSSAFPLISSLLNVHPVTCHDNNEVKDEDKIGVEDDIIIEPSTVDGAISTPSAVPASVDQSVPEKINSSAQPYENDAETIMSTIPGLDSARSSDGVEDSLDASHTFTGELQGTSQEHDLSLGSTVPLDTSSSNCMMTCTSETLSPSLAILDASPPPSNTLVIPTQYVLPKMIVPDVNLSDNQKDNLQKSAFLRILEAYKQVSLCGGSHIHLPLFAHLGIEFPLDLDPWELLQRRVLSDYANNEGHELTLRVLFRLYRESEQDQDFLSSRTATSVYETFLLNVAQTLRDTFPASDKSLGRLLGEVPYLSDGALKLLESLCSPESREKQDKDFQNGDRVTQGLSAVWNLILLRPANRERCLQIALKSAVHHMEEVRMKAIRLVANKLFPMSCISQKIEDFAIENLQSVINDSQGADGSTTGLQRDGDLEQTSSAGQPPVNHPANSEITTDGRSAQTKSSSIPEAQRCMSLYFALCTKKHSLLRHIFTIYESIPVGAKQAVHRHIPILIRTVGPSSELLGVISDLPTGSKNLLMQVLQTLTDGTTPSRDLVSTLSMLYNSRLKDVEILIPIFSSLSKEEVLAVFPQLVNLPLEKFQAAISRLLQGLPQTSSSITPAEVLIAIHAIDPEKDGVPLKKVMEACSACFEQQHMFTQQVLAKVLNQLVEQIPLPLLFMRTVIQAISVYPALVEFVMEILSRLVNKQIWRFPKLWVGFLKCAIQTTPQSFSVLLQLPATQLENALSKNPTLKPPLAEHANQLNIRSTLPRSTLVVLGLVNDPQPLANAQTSQSQAADTVSSAADVTTEVTQESADVR